MLFMGGGAHMVRGSSRKCWGEQWGWGSRCMVHGGVLGSVEKPRNHSPASVASTGLPQL